MSSTVASKARQRRRSKRFSTRTPPSRRRTLPPLSVHSPLNHIEVRADPAPPQPSQVAAKPKPKRGSVIRASLARKYKRGSVPLSSLRRPHKRATQSVDEFRRRRKERVEALRSSLKLQKQQQQAEQQPGQQQQSPAQSTGKQTVAERLAQLPDVGDSELPAIDKAPVLHARASLPPVSASELDRRKSRLKALLKRRPGPSKVVASGFLMSNPEKQLVAPQLDRNRRRMSFLARSHRLASALQSRPDLAQVQSMARHLRQGGVLGDTPIHEGEPSPLMEQQQGVRVDKVLYSFRQKQQQQQQGGQPGASQSTKPAARRSHTRHMSTVDFEKAESGHLFVWDMGTSALSSVSEEPALHKELKPANATVVLDILEQHLERVHCGFGHVLGLGGSPSSSAELGKSSSSTSLASTKSSKSAEGEDSSPAVTRPVFSWGSNAQGQLGLGDTTDRSVPFAVAFPQSPLYGLPIRAVCAGGTSSAFITDTPEGKVFICGTMARLEGSTRGFSSTPVHEPSLDGKDIKLVAFGAEHAAALTESGDLYTWGSGSRGQLGIPSVMQSHEPRMLEKFVEFFITVACGQYHTAAIAYDRNVYTFGANDRGQCGVRSSNGNEDQSEPRVVMKLWRKGAVKVVCARHATAVLTEDGDVYCTGLPAAAASRAKGAERAAARRAQRRRTADAGAADAADSAPATPAAADSAPTTPATPATPSSTPGQTDKPEKLEVMRLLPRGQFHSISACRDHAVVGLALDGNVHVWNWESAGTLQSQVLPVNPNDGVVFSNVEAMDGKVFGLGTMADTALDLYRVQQRRTSQKRRSLTKRSSSHA